MGRVTKPKAKIVLDYQDKPEVPWSFSATSVALNEFLLENKLPGQVRSILAVFQKFGVEISRNYVDLSLHLRALKKFCDKVDFPNCFFQRSFLVEFLKFSSSFTVKLAKHDLVFSQIFKVIL